METVQPHLVLARPDVLGNFLSGMETLKSELPDEPRHFLGNFLSGMETQLSAARGDGVFLPWKLP